MNKHAQTLRAGLAIHPKAVAEIFGTGKIEAAADEIDRLQALALTNIIKHVNPSPEKCLHCITDLDGFCVECGTEVTDGI